MEKGSVVYFKNPVSFGRILTDTEIGPRWSLGVGAPLDKQTTITAAVAGILKSKFIVDDEVSETSMVLVHSADQPDLKIIADVEFFAPSGSPGILTAAERRMLLWLCSLAEFSEVEIADSRDGEFADMGAPALEKPKEHKCTCGKCNDPRSGKKTIEEKAALWDELFGEEARARQNSYIKELETEAEEELIREIVDRATDRIMKQISHEQEPPRRRAPRGFYGPHVGVIPLSEFFDRLF